MGDEFLNEMVFYVLKVPSTVVPGDCNYLINPYHKKSKDVTIVQVTDFPFDNRMFK